MVKQFEMAIKGFVLCIMLCCLAGCSSGSSSSSDSGSEESSEETTYNIVESENGVTFSVETSTPNAEALLDVKIQVSGDDYEYYFSSEHVSGSGSITYWEDSEYGRGYTRVWGGFDADWDDFSGTHEFELKFDTVGDVWDVELLVSDSVMEVVAS